MNRSLRWPVMALFLVAGLVRAEEYSIKIETAAPPKELKEPVAKLLSDKSVQLLDGKGATLAGLWFRKELPANANAAQIKNGLSYRELEETTLIGAIQFSQQTTDFRKQKIKPGVYTLRLAFQPMDGDHMGTAPYPEFCLLVPAALDEKPEPMKTPKELHELSTKASGTSHPAVFLLFPNDKPEVAPKLVSQANGLWVLHLKGEVNANGQKAALGIGLTLIGHAAE